MISKDGGSLCEVLGIRYFNGDAVKADLDHADSLFDIACDHGQAYSCAILGTNVLRTKAPAALGSI